MADNNIKQNELLVEENNKLRKELDLLNNTYSQLQKITANLKENGEKFATVFKVSPDLMLISRASDGVILEVNDGYTQLLGYTPDESIGKTTTDLFIWAISDDLNKFVDTLKKTGRINEFETLLRRKDGSLVTVLDSSRTFELQGEARILSIAHNITNRKKMEDEINKSEKFISNIIENIPDVIFVKAAKDLKFVRLNNAAEEIFGYTKNDMIGKNDYDFFPKEDADFFTNKDREAIKNKKILDIPEEKIHTKSKGERILHTKKITILDESGEPEYLLGISEDITERKKVEEKIKEQNLLLTNILENAPIGFAVNTIDGKAIFVSKKFEEIYGVEQHSLKSSDDFFEKVYVNPVQREEMRVKVLGAIKNGDISKMKWDNVSIITHTGEHKIISATNIPIVQQDLMVSTVQDVSENSKKSMELERMNHFMINRELMMIELKKEIIQLKKQIEKLEGRSSTEK